VMRYCGQFDSGLRQGLGVLTQRLVARRNIGVSQVVDSGSSIWAAPTVLVPLEPADVAGDEGGVGVGVVADGAEGDGDVREVFYQGEWLRNNKHGYGVQVDELGGVYRGGFEDGLRHGSGEYCRCIVALPLQWDRLQQQLIPLLQVTAANCGPESALGTTVRGRWERGVLC
jgi:hypothetical protein